MSSYYEWDYVATQEKPYATFSFVGVSEDEPYATIPQAFSSPHFDVERTKSNATEIETRGFLHNTVYRDKETTDCALARSMIRLEDDNVDRFDDGTLLDEDFQAF